jgi:hypothetical protein
MRIFSSDSLWFLPLLLLFSVPKAEAQQSDPLRLDLPFQSPQWLEISGEQRSRYESLDGQFRANFAGSDQRWEIRTLLRADMDFHAFRLVLEGIDSRNELADEGSPINTSNVDTFELLQGYAAFDMESWTGGEGELRVGRQTLDLGSRRLVARNRFRNTINSFTGVHGSWERPAGDSLQAFYFLPVDRLPNDRDSLLENDTEFDEEDFDTQFWGLFYETPEFGDKTRGEFYLFGLHEEDRADRPTADRELYTPGFRFVRDPAKGKCDFQWESVLQFGHSRATASPSDTQDLDHLAHYHHLQAGYTLDTEYAPRLALLFDYASGDEDPNDGDNNRFDTLFGARRFDYGPTGTYGAFARSNIISPGYQLTAKPSKKFDFLVGHRLFWLASDRDAWTTAGVRDPSGNSGSFIGQQVEASLRWKVCPDLLTVEVGAAHLFAGEFMREAPNSNGEGDATYGYFQTTLEF